MRCKKRILSFVLAALAMVAFAAPSMASATEWTLDGKSLEGPVEFEYSEGTLQWSAGGGAYGYKCDFNATVALPVSGEGEIDPSFPGCKGLGMLSGLTAEAVPLGAPWSIQGGEGGAVEISDFAIELNWSPKVVARMVTTGELLLEDTAAGGFFFGEPMVIASIGTTTNGVPAAVTGALSGPSAVGYGWAP